MVRLFGRRQYVVLFRTSSNYKSTTNCDCKGNEDEIPQESFYAGMWLDLRRRLFAQQSQQSSRYFTENFAAPVNNANWPVEFNGTQPQSDQSAMREIFTHNAFGHDADSRAMHDCFFDHLQVVKVEYNIHVDPMVPEISFNLVTDRQILIETNEGFAFESTSSDRLASG